MHANRAMRVTITDFGCLQINEVDFKQLLGVQLYAFSLEERNHENFTKFFKRFKVDKYKAMHDLHGSNDEDDDD